MSDIYLDEMIDEEFAIWEERCECDDLGIAEMSKKDCKKSLREEEEEEEVEDY